MLRAAMESAFGGSDADGAWDWKTAYDACEAATVLFLRKFGPAMRARAAFAGRDAADAGEDRRPSSHPHAPLRREPGASAVLARRSRLASSASTAAAITPADRRAGAVGRHRACSPSSPSSPARRSSSTSSPRPAPDFFRLLFPGIAVTRFDAAHIDDHLDAGIAPSVVLMNPPFSAVGPCRSPRRRRRPAPCRVGAGAPRRGRAAGRDHRARASRPTIRPGATPSSGLQERGRVVFSAAIDWRGLSPSTAPPSRRG